jgi:hypothetical protein
MRIGVLRYPVRTTDGLAHYEMVFLDALAEAAAENPQDEIVCLVGPENDFFSLVTGDLPALPPNFAKRSRAIPAIAQSRNLGHRASAVSRPRVGNRLKPQSSNGETSRGADPEKEV